MPPRTEEQLSGQVPGFVPPVAQRPIMQQPMSTKRRGGDIASHQQKKPRAELPVDPSALAASASGDDPFSESSTQFEVPAVGGSGSNFAGRLTGAQAHLPRSAPVSDLKRTGFGRKFTTALQRPFKSHKSKSSVPSTTKSAPIDNDGNDNDSDDDPIVTQAQKRKRTHAANTGEEDKSPIKPSGRRGSKATKTDAEASEYEQENPAEGGMASDDDREEGRETPQGVDRYPTRRSSRR